MTAFMIAKFAIHGNDGNSPDAGIARMAELASWRNSLDGRIVEKADFAKWQNSRDIGIHKIRICEIAVSNDIAEFAR